ncbi:MAG: VWA domain-containing protein, partial [Candidatus Dormibacterales bacterium]
VVHPARFILVGTMNPEEGELRPQLLDRFGLCVDVEGIRDPDQRVAVNERVERFGRRDRAFLADFQESDAEVAAGLAASLEAISAVPTPEALARVISSLCLQAGVAGHRADVVIARAARALAAYRGKAAPDRGDVMEVADLALVHRARRAVRGEAGTDARPGEPAAGAEQREGEGEAEGQPEPGAAEGQEEDAAQSAAAEGTEREGAAGSDEGQSLSGGRGPEAAAETADEFAVKKIELPRVRRLRKQSGKRAASQSADRRGRYVRAQPSEPVSDLAVDATVRAAAPHQARRGRAAGERLRLERHDLREKVRERKIGNLIVFVVDASASMDAEQRMAATKGAILSLLQDAYVRRDRVAVVVFKNRSAEVVLRPTSSVALARRRLERLAVGGTTPLTHGLMAGYKVVKSELLRDATVRPLLVLISDGRGNISMYKEEPLIEAQKVAAMIQAERIDALVIDSARDFSGLPSVQQLARVAPMYQTYAINACADLAERMGARYCGLYDLSREEIASAIQRQLGRR